MMQKMIALFLCGILARNLYAMPCYVSEIDTQYDMVCFTDLYSGNDWWMEEAEDWCVDDCANLVMFDMFTAEIYDDVIIRATYDRPDLYVEYMRGAENND